MTLALDAARRQQAAAAITRPRFKEVGFKEVGLKEAGLKKGFEIALIRSLGPSHSASASSAGATAAAQGYATQILSPHQGAFAARGGNSAS
jgi:hypothetical protein